MCFLTNGRKVLVTEQRRWSELYLVLICITATSVPSVYLRIIISRLSLLVMRRY